MIPRRRPTRRSRLAGALGLVLGAGVGLGGAQASAAEDQAPESVDPEVGVAVPASASPVLAPGQASLTGLVGGKLRLDLVGPQPLRRGISGFLAFRAGLGGGLEYQFPLRLAYHVDMGSSTLVVGGGASGLAVERLEIDGVRHRHLLLPVGASVAWYGGSALHWVAALSGQRVFDDRDQVGTTAAGVTWAAQLRPGDDVEINLAAELGASRGEAQRRARVRLILGGVATDGYAPLAPLVMRLGSFWSVLLAPSLAYDLNRGKLDAGILVGLGAQTP